ncbi:unnamed protein product [Cunninghamella echinulata]
MGSLLKNVFNGLVTTDINYIQYAIYLPLDKSIHAELNQTESTILTFINCLLRDYLWQKDGFQLSIIHSNKQEKEESIYIYQFIYTFYKSTLSFLIWSNKIWNCLHDEWFIIYLLYQISKRFSEVIITVSDNDGDVLLIEAALNYHHG